MSIKRLPIKQIVALARYKAVRDYGDSNLRDKCLQCARMLKKMLIENGYIDAIVIMGTFQIDNPSKEFYEKHDPSLFKSKEELEDAAHNPMHYWVELSGYILDITASQFDDELNTPISPIQIGAYSTLPRYHVTVRDW
jgi:hypothetical protein